MPALITVPALGAEENNRAADAAPVSIADILVADARVVSAFEQQAIHFRRVQTEFMVAGLSCRHTGFDQRYNTFVIKYRGELRRNANVLKRIFARAYGRNARQRLDSFVTGLANEASMMGSGREDFCEDSARRIGSFLNAETLEAAMPTP
jgi:hypothetical protein